MMDSADQKRIYYTALQSKPYRSPHGRVKCLPERFVRRAAAEPA